MRGTEASHFWLGQFPNEKRVAEYVAEVYDDDDEDREHTPLSQFARDQGEKWYDHDCMEHGFEKNATRRAAKAGLTKVNMLLFISKDQIDKPRSVEGDGYNLHYMGTIEYRI